MKRGLALLGTFLVLNTTGCALLQLIAIPFKLLFSLFGAAGSAIGVAYATPPSDPPAMVSAAGEETWLVEGLRRDEPCRITCSAPGRVSRSFEWPRDFEGSDGNVTVLLDRVK
jgi:hypothetical protein